MFRPCQIVEQIQEAMKNRMCVWRVKSVSSEGRAGDPGPETELNRPTAGIESDQCYCNDHRARIQLAPFTGKDTANHQ